MNHWIERATNLAEVEGHEQTAVVYAVLAVAEELRQSREAQELRDNARLVRSSPFPV